MKVKITSVMIKIGAILIIVYLLYSIDKEFFMKNRVLRHSLWEYDSGSDFGDFIYTDNIIRFDGSKMVIKDYHGTNYTEKILILKWEYFSSMKVQDPITNKTAIYSMKGANWMDYFFK